MKIKFVSYGREKSVTDAAIDVDLPIPTVDFISILNYVYYSNVRFGADVGYLIEIELYLSYALLVPRKKNMTMY